MISYKEAISMLQNEALEKSISEEMCAIEFAVGRVAGEDLRCEENIPGFDNSAMDGFAISSLATKQASSKNPVRFRVLGTIAAGDDFERFGGAATFSHAPSNCAWEIMTGAPMPSEFFDAVVRLEDVDICRIDDDKNVEIILKQPVDKGENVRLRGSDFRSGKEILKKNNLIQPHHVLALAVNGVTQVRVRRKIRIAIISTGRELVSHAENNLAPGMIRNSTAPYLKSLLPLYQIESSFHGTVPDDAKEFEKIITQILDDPPDIIVTTGAVSMGKFDFVLSSVKNMKGMILFHKVAIRPGKPILFARIGQSGPVLFGLPGNPTATMVGVRFFVEPYIRALLSLPIESPVLARLDYNTKKPDGLRCFYKGKKRIEPEGARVEALLGQESYRISPLLDTNSWVVFGEENDEVTKESVVEVYPLISGLRG